MVSKRIRYRWRRSKPRPETPAPTTGWLLAELAEIVQLPLRTLQYYVQLDLLEPTELRGTVTRYQRRELLRLLGVLRLKSETRLTLADIKRKLHAFDETGLEAWLRERPLPPTAEAALGCVPGSPQVPVETSPLRREALQHGSAPSTASAHARLATATAFDGNTETWQRVRLLPGLELMLSSTASPVVRRAAQSIYAEYVAPSSQAAVET